MTDRQRIEALERALVKTMVKAHRFSSHLGTNFEDETLRLIGETPPSTIDYDQKWRLIAAHRGIVP